MTEPICTATHWILDGHTPVACTCEQWAQWFEKADRHVAQSTLDGGVKVSTVFLGIDHRFYGEGPPLLFERMIFGGPHSQYQERYSTWEDAERGHRDALALAESGQWPPPN